MPLKKTLTHFSHGISDNMDMHIAHYLAHVGTDIGAFVKDSNELRPSRPYWLSGSTFKTSSKG